MKIRFANITECLQIAKVYKITWQQTYRGLISQRFLNRLNEQTWVERLRKQIEGGKTKVVIAKIDNQIVGVIGYGRSRWDESMEWAEIYSLYVLPDYQRKNIGKQLVTFVENDVYKQYKQIKILALKDNQNAINFYKKWGMF